MASNDPSRRASVASTTSDVSLLDQANVVKAVARKEKANGSVKLKKAIVKNAKPKADGDGSEIAEPKAGVETRSPTPESPIPEADLGKPIEDRPDHIQCKHCKKPTPKAVAQSHVKLCERKKKEKARKKKEAKEAKAAQAREKEKADKQKEAEEAADGLNAASKPAEEGGEPSAAGEDKAKIAKKSAGKAPDGPKTTKKRKADGDGDKEPKKKKLKKDEPPKPKLPKPKGPVDVEKQCGVLLPNGGYCARSLTCKSHSMGAKRAVPGRSLPYDILLASYQKKNQAKQQIMAPSTPSRDKSVVIARKTVPRRSGDYDITRAAAPGARVKKSHSDLGTRTANIHHPTVQQMSTQRSATTGASNGPIEPAPRNTPATQTPPEAALSSLAPIPDDLEPAGPIDSDEETEAVMAGIRRSRPQPLAQHYHIDTRRRYEVIRRKEALRQALSGPNGARLFAVGPVPVVGNTGASAPASGGNDDVDLSVENWPDDAAPTRKASVASAGGQKSATGGGPSRKASVA